MHLECIECGKKHDLSTVANTCSCDGLLEIRYDFSKVRFSLEDLSSIPPHVWKYRATPSDFRSSHLANGGGDAPIPMQKA